MGTGTLVHEVPAGFDNQTKKWGLCPSASKVWPWGLVPDRLQMVNPGTPDERELKLLSDNNRLRKGALLRIMTPGGGGWGDPLDRDAAQARDDVLDGFVSAASALEDYGVVFAPATLEVDESATRQQRLRMRRQIAMFHRKEYLTAID